MFLGRFYDGWYPPPQMKKSRKVALSNHVSSKSLKERKHDFSKAAIKCGPKPAMVPHCGGGRYKPCLFNLKADPCEYRDVSEKFPIIYKIMLARLEVYRENMVKSRRSTYRDPRANPKKHNGVWLPWKQLKTKKNSSFFGFFNPFPYSFSCALNKY